MSTPTRRSTARIVSAYVAVHALASDELPGLIHLVRDALWRAADPAAFAPVDEPPKPSAREIRRSVRPDALVSFLDGKSYKTLKRHLNRHGLTEADYRRRFGLPDDYPFTAPEYRERRQAMAKAAGLGKIGRGP